MMSEIAIPMGFRFDPTDEELIKFLTLQVNGDPLPWNGVVYKDLYVAAPWVVFANDADCYWHFKNEGGATKATTFVFTKLIRIQNSKLISRTIAGGGKWHGQTGPKEIFSSDTREAIGDMRQLSFKCPDLDGASPEFGHWIMHEYSLNVTTKGAAAADMVVCKITRSIKNSSGSSRCQPSPPLFSSPAIANGGISECIQTASKRPAEECKVQKLCGDGFAAEAKQPPPLFSSPVIASGGISEGKQIASKRAAEECSFQERKVRKLCGDGFAAEVKPPSPSPPPLQYYSPAIPCVEEKPGDDGTFAEALQQDENTEPPYGGTAEAAAAAIAEDDDYLHLKALLQDEKTEPLYDGSGGTAEGAALLEKELNDSSLPSSLFEDSSHYDFSFDTDSLLNDPLQVSPSSPILYDFSFDADSFFDDAAGVGPSLWS